MGTNYYTRVNECSHCERYDEIHLGKTSSGWKPTLQWNDGKYYSSWKEMKNWLEGMKIYDEYGRRVLVRDFIEIIESHMGERTYENPPDSLIVDSDEFEFLNREFC